MSMDKITAKLEDKLDSKPPLLMAMVVNNIRLILMMSMFQGDSEPIKMVPWELQILTILQASHQDSIRQI
jgi:hypothetical protein